MARQARTGPWSDYDASATYDELIRPDGSAQRGCVDVVERLVHLGEDVFTRQEAAEAAVRSMGITFTLYADGGPVDRAWPIDVIPRIIAADEWRTVEAGLSQRVTALNLFIDDLYHDQKIVQDGCFPGELVADSVNFEPLFADASPKGGLWAHVCGSDLVRDDSGDLYVLEDNLRIPSGVSYMLENRLVTKRVFADLYRDLDVLPVDSYTERLGARLRSLSPRSGDDPVVVVLTPGVYNAAYHEHVFLASRIGAHLVEGSDLVVDDEVVYMRTVSGPVRVDVIYRRVDDAFLDPSLLRPDSVLGARGLLGAWRAGNVAIANAPGTGVADDKVVYSYVPDIIDYYLGEDPLLPNVPTWRCVEAAHRSHVLANLADLVCKPANESGGKGVTICANASRAELDELRARIAAEPRNWIAQPILNLSSAPTIAGDEIVPRHVDLRPFAIAGEEPFVPTGGLTRVALREGSLIVNSSQGGGSKDTWIVDPSVRPEPVVVLGEATEEEPDNA